VASRAGVVNVALTLIAITLTSLSST